MPSSDDAVCCGCFSLGRKKGTAPVRSIDRRQAQASQKSKRQTPNFLSNHPKFVKIRDINSGSSGVVVLAENKETKEKVAIKFVVRGGPAARATEREVFSLRLCALHPHVLQFKELFLTPSHLGIVVDYAPGGDLADYVSRRSKERGGRKGLPEEEARGFFQEVVVAVDFCHRMGIANRDVKLDNALLGEPESPGGRPRSMLCDFGLSKDELADSICKTVCGTPEYVAPEILLYSHYDGKAADVWSCGIMLFVMLTGEFPFWRQEDVGLPAALRLQRMFPRIVNAQISFSTRLSHSARSLIRAMLTADPAERVSMTQIMESSFFKTHLSGSLIGLNDQLMAMRLEDRTAVFPQTEDDILGILSEAVKIEGEQSNVSSDNGEEEGEEEEKSSAVLHPSQLVGQQKKTGSIGEAVGGVKHVKQPRSL